MAQVRYSIVITVLIGVLVVGSVATGAQGAGALQTQPESDNTITRIQLFENGSARWAISVRTRLESSQEVDDFQRYQDQIRADESSVLAPFRTRMTNVVRTAANATGRPMAADRFAISTRIQEVPQQWGIVTYEFTWIGFGEDTGSRLVIGDVFEGGFFLSSADRLVVSPPSGMTIDDAAPPPDETVNRSLVWNGRRDFTSGHPRVVLEPAPTVTSGTSTDTAATGSPETSGVVPGGGIPWVPVIAGVLILGLLAGLVIRRRWAGATDRPGDGGSSIVTDEDRVRRLLQDNDGQLKQSDIAEQLEWTPSKTSRVLSGMAEAGDLEKVRLGRENVVRLPDESD